MSDKIIIDGGYSSMKAYHRREWYKIPTSISFANNTGLKFGESKNHYDFEGDAYTIGVGVSDETSFSTADFKFKYKFEPLIIKHLRDVLKIADDEVPEVVISLALVDYGHKEELAERCREYVINGKTIKNRITVMPQGIGAYIDYVTNIAKGVAPSDAFVIDIGYNTINAIYFDNGAPVRSKSRGYPNHGVSSIIKQFTHFLENSYSMAFSEQEAIKIFMKGKFTYNGELQPEVTGMIETLKSQFVKTLFNSVLVSDKKLISTSEKVILAGGGVYYFDSIDFPPNVDKVENPYEFSNIRGMMIDQI
ncbi:DnaK-like chaperone [Yersinia phage YerA41]|nr:DnaK-like chaperone [Yersinia phage YerA41]